MDTPQGCLEPGVLSSLWALTLRFPRRDREAPPWSSDTLSQLPGAVVAEAVTYSSQQCPQPGWAPCRLRQGSQQAEVRRPRVLSGGPGLTSVASPGETAPRPASPTPRV